MKIKQHTFELGKALTETRNASTRLEVLVNDMGATHTAKQTMKGWVRMLNRIQSEFKMLIGGEAYRRIIEDQLLNDEQTGQIDVITDMLLAMPKALRDQVETYTTQLCGVYAKKESETN